MDVHKVIQCVKEQYKAFLCFAVGTGNSEVSSLEFDGDGGNVNGSFISFTLCIISYTYKMLGKCTNTYSNKLI